MEKTTFGINLNFIKTKIENLYIFEKVFEKNNYDDFDNVTSLSDLVDISGYTLPSSDYSLIKEIKNGFDKIEKEQSNSEGKNDLSGYRLVYLNSKKTEPNSLIYVPFIISEEMTFKLKNGYIPTSIEIMAEYNKYYKEGVVNIDSINIDNVFLRVKNSNFFFNYKQEPMPIKFDKLYLRFKRNSLQSSELQLSSILELPFIDFGVLNFNLFKLQSSSPVLYTKISFNKDILSEYFQSRKNNSYINNDEDIVKNIIDFNLTKTEKNKEVKYDYEIMRI